MPRRSILSATEIESLLALPDAKDELIRRYTFNDATYPAFDSIVYTDTAGFTDHVFALMHLLGFRFAPRIRDLGDTKLFITKGDTAYDALKPMISSDRLEHQGYSRPLG